MSKKQEGNIQYVNFKQEQRQTVISEKTLKNKKTTNKKNIDVKSENTNNVSTKKAAKKTVMKSEKNLKVAETLPKTEKPNKEKVVALKDKKQSKPQKTVKAKNVVEIKAEKPTKKTEVKIPKAKEMKNIAQEAKKPVKKVKAQTKVHEVKNDVPQNTPSQNKIREFMNRCEIYSILDGKQKCSLAWSSDATNKEIYTKALKAIVKASKSARKFKMQAAS